MSLDSLIEDSGQYATITAEAPDGEVPPQDPTGAADRSDANWVTVAGGVPCLVSPKSSAVRAYPGVNDSRQAIVDARIYFLEDPVPTIGLSSRNRVTVTQELFGGPQVLGVYAVLGVINPNTMDRLFEVDCERVEYTMSGIVNFNGNGALDHCRERAIGFITRAANAIERRARELLSIPGTAFAIGKGKGKKGKRKKGVRKDNQVRSKPGEPPRKQTGRLRASVTTEINEQSVSARVGTNVLYGKALEFGTKKGLKPRPWLRRAAFEMKAKVNELLSQIGTEK